MTPTPEPQPSRAASSAAPDDQVHAPDCSARTGALARNNSQRIRTVRTLDLLGVEGVLLEYGRV